MGCSRRVDAHGYPDRDGSWRAHHGAGAWEFCSEHTIGHGVARRSRPQGVSGGGCRERLGLDDCSRPSTRQAATDYTRKMALRERHDRRARRRLSAWPHLNIFYPVDRFPFTDGAETDPETGESGSLLARAEARHVAPKIFHILSNSEYFNRAGSLIHTDPTGTRDIEPPPGTRIYFIASGPHYSGPVPPSHARRDDLVGLAPLNPLNRSPVVRALFQALDRWVVDGVVPPPSRYPYIADGTLVTPLAACWPVIPCL